MATQIPDDDAMEIFRAFHPQGRGLKGGDVMAELDRKASSQDGAKAMAAAIAEQAKVVAEQTKVIADLAAKLAEQGEAMASMSKAQAAALAAGFDGLKAVLMAPVELEVEGGKDGQPRRARRVMENKQ